VCGQSVGRDRLIISVKKIADRSGPARVLKVLVHGPPARRCSRGRLFMTARGRRGEQPHRDPDEREDRPKAG